MHRTDYSSEYERYSMYLSLTQQYYLISYFRLGKFLRHRNAIL